MTIKTSVTLSEDLLEAVDAHIGPAASRSEFIDPVRGKPRRLGRGRIAQTSWSHPVAQVQCGVFCCSMYWRTMAIGAPPQLEAK